MWVRDENSNLAIYKLHLMAADRERVPRYVEPWTNEKLIYCLSFVPKVQL